MRSTLITGLPNCPPCQPSSPAVEDPARPYHKQKDCYDDSYGHVLPDERLCSTKQRPEDKGMSDCPSDHIKL